MSRSRLGVLVCRFKQNLRAALKGTKESVLLHAKSERLLLSLALLSSRTEAKINITARRQSYHSVDLGSPTPLYSVFQAGIGTSSLITLLWQNITVNDINLGLVARSRCSRSLARSYVPNRGQLAYSISFQCCSVRENV